MLHHIGIYATNMERSVQFYETLLPVLEKERLQWNTSDLVLLKGEGFLLELIPDVKLQAQHTHIAFSVTSISDKVRELSDCGIMPAEGPYHLENGWETVFYEGPDGEEIEFINTKHY